MRPLRMSAGVRELRLAVIDGLSGQHPQRTFNVTQGIEVTDVPAWLEQREAA